MEKLTVTGFLGRDAKIIETKNGNRLLALAVGVHSFRNKQDVTNWYDVLYSNFTDRLADTLKKGSAVILSGDFDVTKEVGSDGVERIKRTIFADYVQFNVTGGGKQQEGGEQQPQTQVPKQQVKPTNVVDEDEEFTTGAKPKTSPAPAKTSVQDDDNDLPF